MSYQTHMKRLKKCLSCKTPFKWEVERYCPKCGWDSKMWYDGYIKEMGP